MIYIRDKQVAAYYVAALFNARNNLNNNEVVTITALADTYLPATGLEVDYRVNHDYGLLLDKLDKAKDKAYNLLGQEAIVVGLDEVCNDLPEEEQERFRSLHVCPLADSCIQELIYLQGARDALQNPDLMKGLLNIADQLPQDLQTLDLPTA